MRDGIHIVDFGIYINLGLHSMVLFGVDRSGRFESFVWASKSLHSGDQAAETVFLPDSKG